MQRAIEEITNERRILEGKWKQSDSIAKQREEENRSLRVNLEKVDAIAKVTTEQLENAKSALEEVSTKKQQELDLLSREL